MELKQFVKSVLKDVVDAVEEMRQESSRDMHLNVGENKRTVEFDIAVTVEDSTSSSGKAGIKVFQVVEGGGGISKDLKNSSVSRIKFGVYIDELTKEEEAQRDVVWEKMNEENPAR
ncbi:MAG: trypco2 family protein [Patescibacteria group bacterium]